MWHAEISGLVVDEKFRGAGIGRQLVARAQQWTNDQGLKLLRVRSRIERERTQGFYLGLGFEAVKIQRVFEKKS